MTLRHPLLFLSILLPLLACATGKGAPRPRTHLTLGPYHAQWVDHGSQNLCTQSPSRLLAELQDSHSLLQSFLSDTGLSWRGEWPESGISLLEEGTRSLPSALNTLEQTHTAIARCAFDTAYEFGSLLTQGQTLIRQTRARLELAPALLNSAKARRELEAWRKEQPEVKEASRKQWCRAGVSPTTIYYSAEDETGQQMWSFCDGTEVVRTPNGQPRLQIGGAEGNNDTATYLKAAERSPSNTLLRAPKLPPPLD